MDYKVNEEFIREAHGEACSKWKEKIEKQFPEIFKPNIKLLPISSSDDKFSEASRRILSTASSFAQFKDNDKKIASIAVACGITMQLSDGDLARKLSNNSLTIFDVAPGYEVKTAKTYTGAIIIYVDKI